MRSSPASLKRKSACVFTPDGRLGNLADPYLVDANLAEARKHIDEAIKTIKATRWPRSAD